MKKILSILILSSFVFNPAFAQEIGLDGVKKNEIQYKAKVVKDEKDLAIDEDTALKGIIGLQQQKDLEDIDALWKATVENNNIIKFAMKKLSVPQNQQRYHSSVLAKSVSALVNGASFLPAMFGANYMVQSASYATGRLANNYIAKSNNPKQIPLTDTELIELAGMIESLQDQIINTYYKYKMVLNQIKDTRQRLVLSNKNYSQALKNENQMEIVVSSAIYDDLMFEEFVLMKEARKYQMELERLAGKSTVENLNLCQYAFKNELFSRKLMKSKTPQNSDSSKNTEVVKTEEVQKPVVPMPGGQNDKK